MKSINDEITEALERVNQKYAIAHRLMEERVVSFGLGMYTETLAHMESCCDIARLFAESRDIGNALSRFIEAMGCLQEIIGEYSGKREELVELAYEKYKQSFGYCNKMMMVAA